MFSSNDDDNVSEDDDDVGDNDASSWMNDATNTVVKEMIQKQQKEPDLEMNNMKRKSCKKK